MMRKLSILLMVAFLAMATVATADAGGPKKGGGPSGPVAPSSGTWE